MESAGEIVARQSAASSLVWEEAVNSTAARTFLPPERYASVVAGPPLPEIAA